MTFDQLAQLLYGVGLSELTKEERQVVAVRLNEIFADSVHFVAVGANKKDRWLVRKQRKRGEEMTMNPTGPQLVNVNGRWLLVAPSQKTAEGGTQELRLSPTLKSSLVEMLANVSKQLTALSEKVQSATEAEDVAEIPGDVQKALSAVVKALSGEKEGADGDEKTKEESTEETKPAATGENTTDGTNKEGAAPTFTLKNGEVLTGQLAKMASDLAKMAGERLNGDEDFGGRFDSVFADAARLHQEIEPAAGFSAAVANVQKSVEGKLAKLEAENQRLSKMVEQFSGGIPLFGMPTIPEGKDTEPVRKERPAPAPFQPILGQDLGNPQNLPAGFEGFGESGK